MIMVVSYYFHKDFGLLGLWLGLVAIQIAENVQRETIDWNCKRNHRKHLLQVRKGDQPLYPLCDLSSLNWVSHRVPNSPAIMQL